ncbi:MAG TPA: hypothetical protein EYP56_20855 [Planctomycetaceae bacterium]|nr:hypothetical protein [Planctomycetaceae bacterium]
MRPLLLAATVCSAVVVALCAASGCRPRDHTPREQSGGQSVEVERPDVETPRAEEKTGAPEPPGEGSTEPAAGGTERSDFVIEGPPPMAPHAQETSPPAEQELSPEAAAPPKPEPLRPLVDDRDSLEKLHPEYPIWFDKGTRSVVLMGTVCQRQVPLELFACLKGTKEHESVVSVDTKAYIVHAGLLVAGAEPGNPVQFYPEYLPARGTEIEVMVRWKDADGKVRQAKAQQWVRSMETGKAMEHPWVFAGSFFFEDKQTHQRYYQADIDGDLICVANFPGAVLDVPVPSSDSNSALLFEAFTEHIPPLGTPVTLVLQPKLPPEKPGPDEAAPAEPDRPADKPAGSPPQ